MYTLARFPEVYQGERQMVTLFSTTQSVILVLIFIKSISVFGIYWNDVL